MTHPTRIIFVCFAIFSISCGKGPKQSDQSISTGTQTNIKYAKGFRVTEHPTYKEVEVIQPYKGARAGYRYLLVQRGATVPDHDAAVQVITIPLETIVCTSTTHIPLLDYLDESNKLTGFPTTDYISSEKMRKRIEAGSITELGTDKGNEHRKSGEPSTIDGNGICDDRRSWPAQEASGDGHTGCY